jgi:hypothetical protein
MKKFIIILVCILPSWAWAVTYYVSTTGNDNNAGTNLSPWAHHPWDTAAAGTADGTTLSAGDTVYYLDGNFTGVRINALASGSSGSFITTTSVNGPGKTTLTGNGTNALFTASGRNYIALTNLTADGNNINGSVVFVGSGTGGRGQRKCHLQLARVQWRNIFLR